jgi:hypothetical protein
MAMTSQTRVVEPGPPKRAQNSAHSFGANGERRSYT